MRSDVWILYEQKGNDFERAVILDSSWSNSSVHAQRGNKSEAFNIEFGLLQVVVEPFLPALTNMIKQ